MSEGSNDEPKNNSCSTIAPEIVPENKNSKTKIITKDFINNVKGGLHTSSGQSKTSNEYQQLTMNLKKRKWTESSVESKLGKCPENIQFSYNFSGSFTITRSQYVRITVNRINNKGHHTYGIHNHTAHNSCTSKWIDFTCWTFLPDNQINKEGQFINAKVNNIIEFDEVATASDEESKTDCTSLSRHIHKHNKRYYRSQRSRAMCVRTVNDTMKCLWQEIDSTRTTLPNDNMQYAYIHDPQRHLQESQTTNQNHFKRTVEISITSVATDVSGL